MCHISPVVKCVTQNYFLVKSPEPGAKRKKCSITRVLQTHSSECSCVSRPWMKGSGPVFLCWPLRRSNDPSDHPHSSKPHTTQLLGYLNWGSLQFQYLTLLFKILTKWRGSNEWDVGKDKQQSSQLLHNIFCIPTSLSDAILIQILRDTQPLLVL